MATSQQITSAEVLVAYLMRGLKYRIDWDSIGNNRRRNLTREMADYLVPAAVSARSTAEWVRLYCQRFQIDPTGEGYQDRQGGAYVLIPRRFLPPATVEMLHQDSTDGADGIACVRWDHLTSQIDFGGLRLALERNPAMLVNFAMNQAVDGEESLFTSHNTGAVVAPWSATLPKRIQTPRAYRTIIQLTSPCTHGADHKSGNVTMFRRQRYVCPVSGETYWAPFISGNAWRGIWRDEMGAMTCRDVGLRLEEIDPKKAHALMSGGTIEAGADGAGVDVALRRTVRAQLPGWDLFAGVMNQQIMRGVLRVHDSQLICRENAWFLHSMLAPKRPDSDVVMPFAEFRAALEPADNYTQLRLLTRHAHRELEGSEGMQMLTETEVLLPGAQMVHAFQLIDLNGVSSLAKSFLARLLAEFRDNAFVGAGNARGLGAIAFDPYAPGDPSMTLPSEDEYLAFVAENREAIRGFLVGERGGVAVQMPGMPEGVTSTRITPGKGGRKGKAAAVEADATPATPDPALGVF